MARTINRLSHRKVETLKEPGMHSDGGGLYLQVTQGSDGTPRKSWLFRFAVSGRERQMGLGPLADVPLAEARDLALAAREMRRAGKDPITEREVSRAKASLVAAKSMSFDECCHSLHCGSSSGLAQRQTRQPMDEHGCYLLLTYFWKASCSTSRCWTGDESD